MAGLVGTIGFLMSTKPAPVVTATAPRTAAITNLGCKVNQSEMEAAARLLRQRRRPTVADDAAADLLLVNTCTVTATADQKSRQAVRRARRASPDARIVVTGCSVQVGREAFAAADPAARSSTTGRRTRCSPRRARRSSAATARIRAPSRRPLPTLSGVESTASPTAGPRSNGRARSSRSRTAARSSAPTASSRPLAARSGRLAPETVLADVRRALAAGHREIVLTGINIGTYDGGWSERGFRGARTRPRP